MEAAGWFVGPIMEKLIDAGFDYLKNQVGRQKRMEKKLERLQDILPKIRAVVETSNETQISDQNLNKWVWQLRDAVDEAEDVLDDFEYKKLEEQVIKNKKLEEQVKKKDALSFISPIKEAVVAKSGKRGPQTDPILERLEEVVNKLDNVSAGVNKFLHLLDTTKQKQQEQQLDLYKNRETGSLRIDEIIGRAEDKKFVMEWLSEPSNEEHQARISGTTLHRNISLLSIVGHGGMGKTTLLQHVYEDEMTREFDRKMWVCVSNNFDAKRVIANMLESLTKKKPDLGSLDALQNNLKSEVNSKKFLLVLDDIWEEDKSQWEKVLAPLAYGSLGSKILITTRLESVASMMANVIRKKKKMLRLQGLEENECLQLLNTHAFADVENPDDHKKLRSIAGEIAKKLLGSPLAAKIMGGILNSCLDERHWDNVLNSDSLRIIENDILPILKLSYTFLPKSLQRCFAFCCIFPQDHEFDKDDLVRMWIALGFIQPSDIRGETMEDIGGRYFDALVKKSFFDKLNSYRDHHNMHDLLHELAQSVSKHECLRVESDEELFFEAPETIRHLFLKIRNQEVLKKIENFKNLRSLYLIYDKGNENVDVIIEIFKVTRSIRLLCIYAPDLKMIPQEIGYLTHLRYVKLVSPNIFEWPRSLCNLYHLQFIISMIRLFRHGDDTYGAFPRDINNLSNLRFLKCLFSWSRSIAEIGKLTSLQELGEFNVKNESGYRIGELEQMNDLRKLGIKFLENVEDAQEACNAKLSDKRNLMDLSLKWDTVVKHIDLDEKVFDNLQPPRCLQKLKIFGYSGARSAIWMNEANFISNLEIIELADCMNWQTLPPFGQLLFLESLFLDNMPKVKRFDNKFHGNDEHCVFPSLKMLRIRNFEALEDWFDAEAAAAADHCMFPCLTELQLTKCPKLQELPYLPPKLRKLNINNVGWKTLYCCSISKHSPLEELHVVHSPNIRNISLARLAALRRLEIKDCPNLISLGGHQEVETTENCQLILRSLRIDDPSILLMEPLRSISSLRELNIVKNDALVSFPSEAEQWFLKDSSSLNHLTFAGLKSLQSLPSSLETLSSLKTLRVDTVPQLRELPNLPPSLYELKLRSVPQLRELPNLPPSLCELVLTDLYNLDCLPSCLATLKYLRLTDIPQLQDLPDLPSSLYSLSIHGECHPELKKRYRRGEGSDWHKIAHIRFVFISTESD